MAWFWPCGQMALMTALWKPSSLVVPVEGSYRRVARSPSLGTAGSSVAPVVVTSGTDMSATEVEVGGDVTLDLSERRQQFVSQQSTVWSRRQQAVCVRRAVKVYGTKKQPNVILDGLNMTVPKGCIYGLLGASGCGKTTLLSCIVGRRRLNAGEIWVLGGKPGSKGSGVPGPRIGYMPQEIALYGEFSIREALIYFGWIANMKTEQVEEKLDFIMKFLQLPSASRMVKNLSGGQQRRTSLAAAMIHSPELLILDEPTVGVDPILRQNIWDYLVDITKNGKVTVIITTHYIEETRQAHMIGLMRGGKFLAEESPTDLLAMHMCETLEEVFLKLSKQQNQGKRRRSSYMQEVMGPPAPEEEPTAFDTSSEISGEYGDNISMSNKDITPNDDNQPLDLPPEEGEPWGCMDYLNVFSTHRMKALLWKNFLWMWRNVGIMAFVIGLPVLQIILFCLSIGRDPLGLHLAVVNDELDDPSYCPPLSGCHLDLLSCQYLEFLKKKTIVVDLFPEEEQAREAVRKGYAWGAMHFLANYSQSLVERLEAGRYANEETINNSDVRVWLDMSNQQIGLLLNRNLVLSFRDFAYSVLEACNYSTNLVESPVRFNHPVYGDEIPNFTDFAAPGVILTIIFFLAVALTSGAMLIERNEGMLERCLVSGITAIEVLFSHVATQFLVMAGQTVLVLLFSFAAFGIQCNGPMLWVVIITMLSGFTGMCFGFVVSCVCDNERSATYLALGSFIPIVMLCGIIWPVEAMHPYLSWVSFILPLTQSTESLRAILARGWGIAYPTVYYGVISSMIWIVIFLSISIFVLKFKKG